MRRPFTLIALMLSLLLQQLSMASAWAQVGHGFGEPSEAAHFEHVLLHLDGSPHHHGHDHESDDDQPAFSLHSDNSGDSISHLQDGTGASSGYISPSCDLVLEQYKPVLMVFASASQTSPHLDGLLRPPHSLS